MSAEDDQPPPEVDPHAATVGPREGTPIDPIDPAATTAVTPEAVDRSRSRQALHDRVRAALFDPQAPRPAPDEYDAGTVVGGRYRVVGLLGRGGMGEVYRARDLVLDEDVAVKFIPRVYADDERFMTRFVREVRLARQITHANVCRVHDIGEIDGRSFLSMEFIDGEDLASLLRRIGRLPLEKAAELAQQLCAGLAALHDRGILHRDLKPHNLMVDGRGHLKITDFGLAAAAGELAAHELRDGTPAYMAPEQVAGRGVTEQTDLYALGLILYEVLSGERIDTRQSPADTSRPDPLSSRVPGVPREVDDVIAACLAPDPADRPRSALAVAAALPGGDPIAAALAAGRAPSVDALLVAGPSRKIPHGRGLALVLSAVAALLACGLLFSRATVLGRAPTPMAPDVLRHEARELLAGFVEAPPYPFEHAELAYDRPVVWERRGSADRESVVLYQYRRQDQLLVPRFSTGMDDPDYDTPGAARVVLDGQGRLRSLLLVPVPGQPARDLEADYAALFAAAGLDATSFQPTESQLVPEIFVDERRAWLGEPERFGTQVRVEGTSRDGRVVSFDLVRSFDPRFSDPQPVPEPHTDNFGPYAVIPAILLLCFGMGWQARRVIQRGTGDPRGAKRVGIIVASVGIAGMVLQPGLVAGGYATAPQRAFFVLGIGLFTYWTYLILEPFSRRYLPGAMTSWVRIVRGQFTDPLVARDVLVGVSLSLFVSALQRLAAVADDFPLAVPTDLDQLGSVWASVSNVSGAMAGTPILFFLLAGLVRLLRKRWLASTVLVVGVVGLMTTFGLASSSGVSATVVASALTGVGWCVAIVRYGLLAAVVFQFVRNLLATVPTTFDVELWYAVPGWVGVAILLGLVLYGARYGVEGARPAPATR